MYTLNVLYITIVIINILQLLYNATCLSHNDIANMK